MTALATVVLLTAVLLVLSHSGGEAQLGGSKAPPVWGASYLSAAHGAEAGPPGVTEWKANRAGWYLVKQWVGRVAVVHPSAGPTPVGASAGWCSKGWVPGRR